MGFWSTIKKDFRLSSETTPLQRNGLEVFLAYPGFHAIVLHRINHILWDLGIPVIPGCYPI